METYIKDFLLKAPSKAIATYGDFGINVVPVSTIFIEGEKIILVDYFMEKTVKNISDNKNVSLVAWKDMLGYQFKCLAEYDFSSDLFLNVKLKVKEILPERHVKGILILSTKEIFDISPTKDTKEHLLSML